MEKNVLQNSNTMKKRKSFFERFARDYGSPWHDWLWKSATRIHSKVWFTNTFNIHVTSSRTWDRVEYYSICVRWFNVGFRPAAISKSWNKMTPGIAVLGIHAWHLPNGSLKPMIHCLLVRSLQFSAFMKNNSIKHRQIFVM